MTTDGERLAAWRDGDRTAGAELFAAHFAAIYGFFRSKLEHLAEDLTQQTFLRCVEARDGITAGGTFRAYLFAIARNVLFEQLRRSAVRRVDPDFDVDSLADLVPSPSALLGAGRDERVLVAALRRLPLELQLAVELYFVEQLRGHEIAQVLALPHGTVRSRIRRGLERLRVNIDELSASPHDLRTTVTDLRRWAARVRERVPATPPSVP